jgi:hypothetical protein
MRMGVRPTHLGTGEYGMSLEERSSGCAPLSAAGWSGRLN